MARTYQRVIPRDLFNEAKLLKCLGQLSLLIHDGNAPSSLKATNSGREFRIEQRPEDGGLYIGRGLRFTASGRRLTLYTAYNSKSSYPLLCNAGDSEIEVFDERGLLTSDFLEYVTTTKGACDG